MILGGFFDYDGKTEELLEVKRELEFPETWNDLGHVQALERKRASLELIITTLDAYGVTLQDSIDLLKLADEEDDQEIFDVVINDLDILKKNLEKLELQRIFSKKIDVNNAYLNIQAGAGGTEAQDWANMILRMYLRWGDSQSFKVELIDVSEGDVVGIKNATIHFIGEYAYGLLRTETGIHRLVRKSPFNSSAKRHTSFASVCVYPEVNDIIEIKINKVDLRIDTYRASGAGGQHVNKTDSAIRITHVPTNTVVQCQNQRSQHRNRETAMHLLRAKLYELELTKQNEKKQFSENNKDNISWGNQIRSYVLDQSRIKDLRTNMETGNTQAVLNGNLDLFIQASLKLGL